MAGGIDIDEACRFPYEANNKAPFLPNDVGILTAADIEKLFVPRTTGVLIGCAPCQPFSKYSPKKRGPKPAPSAGVWRPDREGQT